MYLKFMVTGISKLKGVIFRTFLNKRKSNMFMYVIHDSFINDLFT